MTQRAETVRPAGIAQRKMMAKGRVFGEAIAKFVALVVQGLLMDPASLNGRY